MDSRPGRICSKILSRKYFHPVYNTTTYVTRNETNDRNDKHRVSRWTERCRQKESSTISVSICPAGPAALKVQQEHSIYRDHDSIAYHPFDYQSS